jgi:hypothetical protein
MLPIFIALIVIAGILVIGSSGFLINKRRRRNSFEPITHPLIDVFYIDQGLPGVPSAPLSEPNDPKGGSKTRKSKSKSKISKKTKKSKRSKKSKKSN